VVAVLLPAARVTTDGLQMAMGEGRYPHVTPRRRDGKRPNPAQDGEVPHSRAVRIEIHEAATDAPAANPGAHVAHVAEAGGLRRLDGIRHDIDGSHHARS